MSLRNVPRTVEEQLADIQERLRKLTRQVSGTPSFEVSSDHGGLSGLDDDDHRQYLLRSLFSAIGDLLLGTGPDAVGVLPIGSDGLVLTADSSDPLGASWQAAGASLDVKDEGSDQGPATTMDFVGAGVSASVSGGMATVTIPGGGVPDYAEAEDLAEVAENASAGSNPEQPYADHGHAHGSGYLPDAHHDQVHDILDEHIGFPGGTTDFLREDGTWADPAGGGGGSSLPGLLARRLLATGTHDDQFDDGSLTGWTTIDNVPRCDIDENYDSLSFTVKATGSAKELSCVLKSIPSLAIGDYIEGAFTHHGHNQYHSAALILSDGTTFGTSDQEVVMCYWNTASEIKARLNPINNFNSDAGSGTEKSLGPQEGLYGIRLKWEAANTWGLYISHNGKRWLPVQTNHSRTLTPTHAGVGLLHYDSGANWGQIDWHYFAYNLA